MSDEERKRVMKEAITEWMDAQFDKHFATFGKWVVGTLATLIFAAIVYFILWTHGWKHDN